MSAGGAAARGAGAHGRRDPAPRTAALAAGLVLALVYTATAAPDVTFWDAGEFLSAFATFGIPHPPGTPLFVALGRAWSIALGLAGVPIALAGNLLSAACTAAAGACVAWLVARWTRSVACGIASALGAGAMSTVWASATEAEVYAAALALACAALLAAEHAGPASVEHRARSERRATVLTAYALALAVPLHLSALVVAPAALWLACAPCGARSVADAFRRLAWRRALVLASAGFAIAGVGQAHITPVVLGVLGLVASWFIRPERADGTAREAHRARDARQELYSVAASVLLALSAMCILLVRARHDPWLNQGDPSTWARLVDVVGRRQYAVADLWPRQALWWIQLGNIGEWADWQVALGVAPGAAPGWIRTPVTLAFALLGVVGSGFHRRRDPRSWMAVLLLLGAGSLGVAITLNLKAGPSFGLGVLPNAAPHEARERDYFFALAWLAWGAWAGIGAVAAARRLTRSSSSHVGTLATVAGALVAALPVALNWRTSSRTHTPIAHAARDYARALLANAPPRAVLVVNGDNDTYPVWYAQGATGWRRDVTVVTASLLPARWYRAELARRTGLLDAPDVSRWSGAGPTLASVAAHAERGHRPIVVDLATDGATRRAVAFGARRANAVSSDAGAWYLRGMLLEWIRDSPAEPGREDPRVLRLSPPIAALVGATIGDRPALERAAASAPRIAVSSLVDSTGDGVVAWAYRQLACPAAALAGTADATSSRRARSLEGACRAR